MPSDIEWTDETWNFLAGCTPVSEGCRNCYAAREAVRLAGNPNEMISEKYSGTARMTAPGANRRAVFTGRVNFHEPSLLKPLRVRTPKRWFVNSMSDLFHESVDPFVIIRAFAVMDLARHHTFQILTKRPERAERLLGDSDFTRRLDEARVEVASQLGQGNPGDFEFPLANVWLGTSVEDQAAADTRIPHLLRTPAAVRFLSCEPLLGPVDLRQQWRDFLEGWDTEAVHVCGGDEKRCYRHCPEAQQVHTERVHWVIVGGESGPKARRLDIDWIRRIVGDCRDTSTPVFVKQLGARPYEVTVPGPVGSEQALDLGLLSSKGGDWEEWPKDLRVREFPAP